MSSLARAGTVLKNILLYLSTLDLSYFRSAHLRVLLVAWAVVYEARKHPRAIRQQF
jgi:hypothetical protein